MRYNYKKTTIITIIFSIIMMIIHFYTLDDALDPLINEDLNGYIIAQFAIFKVFGGPLNPRLMNISQMATYMIVPIFLLMHIFSLLIDNIHKISHLIIIRKKGSFKYILYVQKHIILKIVNVILIYMLINIVPILRYVSFIEIFPFLIVTIAVYLLQYLCLSNILFLLSLVVSKLYLIIIYVFTLIGELFFFYLIAQTIFEDMIKTNYSFIVKFFFHTKVFVNYYKMPFNNWHTTMIYGNDFFFGIFYLLGSILIFMGIAYFLIKSKNALIFKNKQKS